MSEQFQPSIAAARGALNDKIEYREHPVGVKGASVSLEEVAKRIREGRIDPRVRAWAGDVLVKAGKPKESTAQAQAILDALREKTMYGADPVGAEMVVAAKNTLCLDEQGLCMRIGDCDDLSVALGSALMSVGIPVKIIGQAFHGANVPSHVLVGIQTPLGLKRLEPSHDTYKVGESHPAATREWIIDPMDSKPVNLSGMSSQAVGGEFVGIGNTPIVDVVTSQVQKAVSTLQDSANSLTLTLDQLKRVRTLLHGADNIYDPEPFEITSLADFPSNGVWTQSMQRVADSLLGTANKLVKAGYEALKGLRDLLVDEATQDIYIQAKPTDDWRLATISRKASEFVIGVYDSAANLIGGLVSSDGKVLTAEEARIEHEKAQSSTVSGLGEITTATAAVIIGGLVIAGISIYYAIGRLMDGANAIAREVTNRDTVKLIATSSPEKARQISQYLLAQRKAEAELLAKSKDADLLGLKGSLKGIGDLVMTLAIGGAIVAGIYTIYPLASEFSKSFAESHRAKRLQRGT